VKVGVSVIVGVGDGVCVWVTVGFGLTDRLMASAGSHPAIWIIMAMERIALNLGFKNMVLHCQHGYTTQELIPIGWYYRKSSQFTRFFPGFPQSIPSSLKNTKISDCPVVEYYKSIALIQVIFYLVFREMKFDFQLPSLLIYQ